MSPADSLISTILLIFLIDLRFSTSDIPLKSVTSSTILAVWLPAIFLKQPYFFLYMTRVARARAMIPTPRSAPIRM